MAPIYRARNEVHFKKKKKNPVFFSLDPLFPICETLLWGPHCDGSDHHVDPTVGFQVFGTAGTTDPDIDMFSGTSRRLEFEIRINFPVQLK